MKMARSATSLPYATLCLGNSSRVPKLPIPGENKIIMGVIQISHCLDIFSEGESSFVGVS